MDKGTSVTILWGVRRVCDLTFNLNFHIVELQKPKGPLSETTIFMVVPKNTDCVSEEEMTGKRTGNSTSSSVDFHQPFWLMKI